MFFLNKEQTGLPHQTFHLKCHTVKCHSTCETMLVKEVETMASHTFHSGDNRALGLVQPHFEGPVAAFSSLECPMSWPWGASFSLGDHHACEAFPK